LACWQHNSRALYLHLQDRASLMAAGHVHPGMMEAVPMRFLWHVA